MSDEIKNPRNAGASSKGKEGKRALRISVWIFCALLVGGLVFFHFFAIVKHESPIWVDGSRDGIMGGHPLSRGFRAAIELSNPNAKIVNYDTMADFLARDDDSDLFKFRKSNIGGIFGSRKEARGLGDPGELAGAASRRHRKEWDALLEGNVPEYQKRMEDYLRRITAPIPKIVETPRESKRLMILSGMPSSGETVVNFLARNVLSAEGMRAALKREGFPETAPLKMPDSWAPDLSNEPFSKHEKPEKPQDEPDWIKNNLVAQTLANTDGWTELEKWVAKGNDVIILGMHGGDRWMNARNNLNRDMAIALDRFRTDFGLEGVYLRPLPEERVFASMYVKANYDRYMLVFSSNLDRLKIKHMTDVNNFEQYRRQLRRNEGKNKEKGESGMDESLKFRLINNISNFILYQRMALKADDGAAMTCGKMISQDFEKNGPYLREKLKYGEYDRWHGTPDHFKLFPEMALMAKYRSELFAKFPELGKMFKDKIFLAENDGPYLADLTQNELIDMNCPMCLQICMASLSKTKISGGGDIKVMMGDLSLNSPRPGLWIEDFAQIKVMEPETLAMSGGGAIARDSMGRPMAIKASWGRGNFYFLPELSMAALPRSPEKYRNGVQRAQNADFVTALTKGYKGYVFVDDPSLSKDIHVRGKGMGELIKEYPMVFLIALVLALLSLLHYNLYMGPRKRMRWMDDKESANYYRSTGEFILSNLRRSKDRAFMEKLRDSLIRDISNKTNALEGAFEGARNDVSRAARELKALKGVNPADIELWLNPLPETFDQKTWLLYMRAHQRIRSKLK